MLHILATTSDEVFKSMGDTANGDINPMHVVSIIAGLIAIVVLVSLFSRRKANPGTPKVVNHSGRLTRELARAMGLKRSELKRLKQLADREGIENPMALLLCPSVLKAALAKGSAPAASASVVALVEP